LNLRFRLSIVSARLRLFFSHYHRDKPLVRQIVEALPGWLTAWVDEDRLCFGDRLTPELKDAIDSQVDYVVLLFNNDAAESAWVRAEIRWALEHERQSGRTFLLPVVLDDSHARLSDLGLGDRLALNLADYNKGSVESLGREIANHVAGRNLKELDVARDTVPIEDSLHQQAEEAVDLIAEIPLRWRPQVEALLMKPFVMDLNSARAGVIPLSHNLYYQRVFYEMSRAGSGTRVLAISTLSSDLWTRDADQIYYSSLNFEAIERGAEIQRLFVVPETHPPAFRAILKEQQEAGINTRVASATLLASVPDLDDFVLLETDSSTYAYVAQPSIVGSRRIRSASLVLTEITLDRMREALREAWVLASPPDEFFASSPPAGKAPPPGDGLPSRHLDHPVVSCEEAAAARGIPLARELKTLLLQTHDHGIVAVHLPGDAKVALRKVKQSMGTAQAYQASLEALAGLGLSPGTICAIKEPVWSMRHLVSQRLLQMDTVMTNDGTKTGYVEFDPAVLLLTDQIVGDFEE
jgi:prolyl-tRNA editing enzyme YbaK/EbsC (Cys-tRNA(Pro) deacylase)